MAKRRRETNQKTIDKRSSEGRGQGKGSDYTPWLRLVWETALSNFWQDHTISVSEIAKQLGVDFQTVKSQALRLGLAFPRKGPTTKVTQLREDWQPAFRRVQTKKPNKLETYRQAWLEAVEENPEAGRTALQQQFRCIYSWLHVYEKNGCKLISQSVRGCLEIRRASKKLRLTCEASVESSQCE